MGSWLNGKAHEVSLMKSGSDASGSIGSCEHSRIVAGKASVIGFES